MKMNIQFFAEKNNIKKLKEQRVEKVQELKDLYETVEAEQRAINEEEEQKVKDIQKEIDDIDKTIKTLEGIKKRLEETGENNEEGGEGASENDESAEQRAQDEEKMFAEYLRGVANGELRADTNMTLTDNGAVIPETIAQKIIEKVYEISPILERATKYNIKGSLVIPFYPADANDIEMAYAD